MPGILVGVDGSDHASRALQWAMNMAAALQAPLTVLVVNPVAVSQWTGRPIVLPEDRTEQEEDRRAAEKAVAEAASRIGQSGPPSVTVVFRKPDPVAFVGLIVAILMPAVNPVPAASL